MRTNRIVLIAMLLALPVAFLLASAEEETDAASEPEVISWHQIGNPQERLPEVMEAVNEYLEETVGVHADITVHGWGDYTTRMQTMHAAGEAFDLAFTAPWANPFVATASKGAYLPLDDLLQEHGQGILATLPEQYWEAARLDGQIMGIINLQIMSNQRGIGIVKEYADRYGFDPDNLERNEDIFSFFQTILDNEDGITPFIGLKEGIYPDLNASTQIDFDWLIGENDAYVGVYMDDVNSPTVVNVIDSPEYRRQVESVRDMLAAGYLAPDYAALEIDEEVMSGNYAAFTTLRVKPGVEGESRIRYGKDIVVFGLHRPYVSTGSASSTMTAIGVNSTHPEDAMRLYDAVYTDKALYNMLIFGIEGVHYTDLGNGYVEQNADAAFALPAWQFGNQFNALLMPGQEEDVWEQTVALDATADLSPIFGFQFDPTPVRNEVAACGAIFAEYNVSVTYAEDLDAALEGFVEDLEDAGIQRVIDEAQQQIDAWVAGR